MSDKELELIKDLAEENNISLEAATEIYVEYFEKQEEEMQDTYNSLIRDMH